MSYALFLLLFLILPIGALCFFVVKRRARIPFSNKRISYSLLSICSVAFLYTIPWDNYLVYRGIWWSPADRIVAKLGYVPLEEYCFFVLLPLFVSLLILALLSSKDTKTLKSDVQRVSAIQKYLPMLGFGVVTLLGIYFLYAGGRHLYAGLLLSWATPIVLAMIIWKPSVLYYNASTLWPSLIISTIYFCAIDLFAIKQGIWTIVEEYSLPIVPFGLPIEEAAFYFLTVILSAYGFLLFLNVWNLYGDDSAQNIK